MRALARNEHEVAFWVRHVRIGVALTVISGLVAIVYELSTPPRPNRGLVLALVGLTVATSPLLLAAPMHRIARHPRGALFFYAWSAAVLVAVTVAMALDGGLDSPVMWLNALALAYATMAYPLAGIVGVGVGAVGLAALVEVFVPSPSGWAASLARLVFLAVLAVMCAAVGRGQRERYEVQALLAERLEQLAHVDALTGTANHRAFHERLDVEVERARRGGRALALLVVDLDRFKTVNDRFGHPAGDEVLAGMGALLRSAARAGDFVARIGGEEFAMLLPEADVHEARAVAERLRGAASRVPAPVPLTLSVGVAALEGEVLDGEMDGGQLFAAADAALYAAKRAGRDRVVVAGE